MTSVAAARRAKPTKPRSCSAKSRRSGGNDCWRKFETRTACPKARPVPPQAGHFSQRFSQRLLSELRLIRQVAQRFGEIGSYRKVTRVFMYSNAVHSNAASFF
jgi:hypothetical protein